MKRAIVAGVLLFGAAVWAWRDHTSRPAEVEQAVEVIEATPPPIYQIPYIPPIPADASPQVHPHWLACGTTVSLQRNEDAALKLVLDTRNEQGPLFGFREITLEMSECSAYRERMAWWPQ